MASRSLQENLIPIGLLAFIICHPAIVKGQTDGFSIQPSDIQVRAGENGSLRCIFTRENVNNCYWNKDNQKVNIDENDRYIYTGNSNNGDCSIGILNSDVNMDEGQWECGIPQTSEVPGLKSIPAKYTVLIIPNEPVIKVNGKSIKNGDYIAMDTASSQNAAMIACLSENGKPAANLIWTIATGQELEGSYSVTDNLTDNQNQTATLLLTTPSDKSWDEQKLTCTAQHLAYRTEESHIAYGIVKSPIRTAAADLTSDYNENLIHVPKNKDVILTCNADGIPAPDLQLKSKFSEAEEWKLRNTSYATNNFTIKISAVDEQFICFASNDNWESSVFSNDIKIVTSDAQQTVTAVAMIYLVAVTIMGSHRVLMS